MSALTSKARSDPSFDPSFSRGVRCSGRFGFRFCFRRAIRQRYDGGDFRAYQAFRGRAQAPASVSLQCLHGGSLPKKMPCFEAFLRNQISPWRMACRLSGERAGLGSALPGTRSRAGFNASFVRNGQYQGLSDLLNGKLRGKPQRAPENAIAALAHFKDRGDLLSLDVRAVWSGRKSKDHSGHSSSDAGHSLCLHVHPQAGKDGLPPTCPRSAFRSASASGPPLDFLTGRAASACVPVQRSALNGFYRLLIGNRGAYGSAATYWETLFSFPVF